MIRLDKTEEIEKQYNEGYLRFGCPANWINYARLQPPGVADRYEAVFAHVRKDDERFGMICDDGYPLNYNRSLWDDEELDGMVYARYTYSTLVPTICFYSLDTKKIAGDLGIKGNSDMCIDVDLKPYYKAMNLSPEEEYSLLIIRFPEMLKMDLWNEIPKAVANTDLLFKRRFDANNPFAIRYVKYNLDITKEFWDLHPYDELFRKRPEFRAQHEARIIIPNVMLTMDPVNNPEMYFLNEIKIPVPNIKDYAVVHPAKYDTIRIEEFNEDLSEAKFRLYKRARKAKSE